MTTRRKQWMTGGLLLAAVLWAGAAGAQNFGTGSQNGSAGTTGSSTGSSSQSNTASVNNAPTFDPAAQAAARLLGTYRVPGSVQIDPTGAYRVPLPDTGGSASAATTTAATPSTTTTSASTATTSTTTSNSP
jgi:hypothetical protein